MRIVKQYDWHRRDFSYDAMCEACGHIHKNKSGYDDEYFHTDVIPTTLCGHCHKSRKDLIGEGLIKSDSEVFNLKYNSNQVI